MPGRGRYPGNLPSSTDSNPNLEGVRTAEQDGVSADIPVSRLLLTRFRQHRATDNQMFSWNSSMRFVWRLLDGSNLPADAALGQLNCNVLPRCTLQLSPVPVPEIRASLIRAFEKLKQHGFRGG